MVSKSVQTDPTLRIDSDLQSPPLDFDHDFNPLNLKRTEGGHICNCMRCNNFIYDFMQEWSVHSGFPGQPEQVRFRSHDDIIPAPWGDSHQLQSPEHILNMIDMRGYSDSYNNFEGGNYIQSRYTSHTITETKARKRSVDLDRLSQSSPDIESTTTASSISSSSNEEIPISKKAKKITPRKISPHKISPDDPVIIIEEEGVPTLVTKSQANIPTSPHIIILDDEGEQPIINLASSPIVIKHPLPPAKEIKTKMIKDSSSYFTPPQTSQSTDDFIKHFDFDNLGVGLERINLDQILQRTTWGGAHDVLEAARVGQHHRIPTGQVTALILRVLPIIGSRARGGELDAVNAVGLIKGRLDDFLATSLVTSSSTASITAPVSVPKSSRSGGSRSKTRSKSKSRSTSPSPAPTTTPDTPTYQPILPSSTQTEGGMAFNRARRFSQAQRGGYNRRALPRMSGPTSHIGNWYFPPEAAAAPPYVADYRYIPGWAPGMPRPPLPWQTDQQGRSAAGTSQGFIYGPQQTYQRRPFYFGRGTRGGRY